MGSIALGPCQIREEKRTEIGKAMKVSQRSSELKYTEAGGQGVADSHSKLHKQDFKINPVETSAQYTMFLAGKEEL